MNIAPTASSLSPSANAAPGAAPAAAITSDFDTFLRMLTAQITNQDPLNPINSEQFAVQLATFSGVEQQVRTNQLLEALNGSLGAPDFGELARWVGMAVQAPMPGFFSGAPLSVAVPAPLAGNRHDLVALNAQGVEIWRSPHVTGAGSVSWSGAGPDGTPVPQGLYAFRLDSFEDDRLVSTAPAQTFGRVEEVRLDQGLPVLVLAGGIERRPDEVTALRQDPPDA